MFYIIILIIDVYITKRNMWLLFVKYNYLNFAYCNLIKHAQRFLYQSCVLDIFMGKSWYFPVCFWYQSYTFLLKLRFNRIQDLEIGFNKLVVGTRRVNKINLKESIVLIVSWQYALDFSCNQAHVLTLFIVRHLNIF